MIFDTYQDSKGNVYKLTTEVEQVIINDMVDLTETIERLHSIIKEVREYIVNNTDNTNFLEVPSKELLEILDKENK